jgi:hypothetical protein
MIALSEWVKFHKKKCKFSVEVWDRELFNGINNLYIYVRSTSELRREREG